MTLPDFETFRSALRSHGFTTESARYHEEAFGSWILSLEEPRARVVWDGKDGWLIVQRWSRGRWDDAWIGREELTQTPDAVVAQLTLLK